MDLRRELQGWRRAFEQRGILDRDELDELESHLVESFESAVRRGMPEADALRVAKKSLGCPASLSAEFGKTHPLEARRLSRALLVAPAVAPLLTAVDVAVVGALCPSSHGPESAIGPPATALSTLTLAVAASYGIVALVGMPILRVLWRRGQLTACTVHATACLIAAASLVLFHVAAGPFTTVGEIRAAAPVGSDPWPLTIASFLLSNVMLSSALFWTMIRDPSDRRTEAGAG